MLEYNLQRYVLFYQKKMIKVQYNKERRKKEYANNALKSCFLFAVQQLKTTVGFLQHVSDLLRFVPICLNDQNLFSQFVLYLVAYL